MKPEQQAALREPFPKSAIGKLPKGTTMLDYVGHAAVTDRLLAVDPEWSWEPLALDAVGLPLFDQRGGLWIRLTIAGVTRLGYGDGPDPKQRIGDAIRNAAMRFGVALDLWAKEDISATTPPVGVDTATGEIAGSVHPMPDPYAGDRSNGDKVTDAQLRKIGALMRGQSREQALAIVSSVVGRDVESRNDLTKREAMTLIDALEKQAATA